MPVRNNPQAVRAAPHSGVRQGRVRGKATCENTACFAPHPPARGPRCVPRAVTPGLAPQFQLWLRPFPTSFPPKPYNRPLEGAHQRASIRSRQRVVLDTDAQLGTFPLVLGP